MSKEAVEKLQQELKDASAREMVRWALARFGIKGVALASSFGAEDQVLTDLLVKENREASVFTLDTGRLPQETHDVLDATQKRYGLSIEVLFPDAAAVEKMQTEHGPDLFYESVEKRKLCCRLRKVEPLKKKLATLDAWITGLRREQSVTRTGLQKIEWDETFGLFKLNPLADWTEEQVWRHVKENNVPYNRLHDRGYPSIGCVPCTRAINPGEDVRAGRWWWENPGHKECGLHIKNGKIVPGRKE